MSTPPSLASSTAVAVPPCAVCRDPLGEDGVVVCPLCDTSVHAGCHDYVGGCVRYACTAASTPRLRLLACLETRTTGAVAGWAAATCMASGFVAAVLTPVVLKGMIAQVSASEALVFASLILAPLAGVLHALSKKARLKRDGISRAELGDLLDHFAPLAAEAIPGPPPPLSAQRQRWMGGVAFAWCSVVVAGAVGVSHTPGGTWMTGVAFSLFQMALGLGNLALIRRRRAADELRRRVGLWKDELEERHTAMLTSGQATLSIAGDAGQEANAKDRKPPRSQNPEGAGR